MRKNFKRFADETKKSIQCCEKFKNEKKKRKTKYFKEISSYRIKKRLKKGRLLK